MSDVKSYEMTIEVVAKAVVRGDDTKYWDGLSELQRGEKIGEMKAEVRRYFSEELDEMSSIDVNVKVTEVSA